MRLHDAGDDVSRANLGVQDLALPDDLTVHTPADLGGVSISVHVLEPRVDALQEIAEARTFGDGHVLKTRCGVNTGEITIGAIGTEGRLAFTVHGDEVNIAARLEQLNKQHGTYILVGENTAEACAELCEFEPVTEVTVRGRSQPTKVFRPI